MLQSKKGRILLFLSGIALLAIVTVLVATNYSFKCSEYLNGSDNDFECAINYTEAATCKDIYAERVTVLSLESKIYYTCPWSKITSYATFTVVITCLSYFCLKLWNIFTGKSVFKGCIFIGFFSLIGLFGDAIWMFVQISESHRDCEKINVGADATERGTCSQVEFLYTIVLIFATMFPLICGLVQDVKIRQAKLSRKSFPLLTEAK